MIGGRPADESVSPVIPIRDAASRRRTACRVWDWAVERPVLSVVCVAAVIRIAVAIALNVLDNWSFALDSGQYLAIAEAKADGRLEEFWIGYGSSLYSSTRTSSGQLSFLFWLFGPYRFLGQLLSVVYGAAAAGLTTSVALRLVRRPLAGRGVGAPVAKLCLPLAEPGDAPGAVLPLHVIDRMCRPGVPRAWLYAD